MRLRRRIATLLVASLSLSTSALALSNPTPAGAVAPGVIDVAVTIDATPPVVSPPGESALYAVQASNPGIVSASSATVTVSLPAGSVYADALSTPACSGSGTTVTCPVGALPAGGVVPFDVVASTPTSAAIYNATAVIQANDLLLAEPLEYQANNTDTTQVDVRNASAAGSFGLVRGGDSLSLDVGDGRFYTMTVPPQVPGVIVSIRPADGTAKACGLGGCDKGFLTEFVQHPYFKAENPAYPLFTTKTFGRTAPCNGSGGGANCKEIYWAKDPITPVLQPMAPCAASGVANPSPCLQLERKEQNSVFWFDVLMLSNDPIELPPLLLGK